MNANGTIFIATKKKPVYQLIKKTKSAVNQNQMSNGNNNQCSEYTEYTHEVSNTN
jgi:hypothetical protein